MRRLLPKTLALLLFALVLTGCASEDRDLTLAVSTEEPAPSIAESIRLLLSERGFSISIDATTDPATIVAAIRDTAAELSMEYSGSTYLFTNQPNLDTFRADPERYLPG